MKLLKTPCFNAIAKIIIAETILLINFIAPNKSVTTTEKRKETVCPSLDVRNQASMLKALENCTVIEGSLSIVLIDHGVWKDYIPHSYPKLVEITDYLLIYRAYGLKSLRHIFPNLAVIRGQNLFVNYALVLFEVPDIEEVGLPSLTSIRRGAVRLEMNSNLCYVDTIDWKQITNLKDEDNFILENKDIDECANVCPRTCPSTDIQVNGVVRKQPLCWDYEHCQIYCPECLQHGCFTFAIKNGVKKMDCCHSSCLGGCRGPTARDCIACKDVFYNGVCQKTCPPNTYKYQQRRCITEEECRKISNFQDDIRWKLLKTECARECPSGYIESEQDPHLCEKCKGQCPKVCGGLSIDSVAAAQKLRGCTIIHGILEIQIRGGKQVGLELEQSLGSIEEVSNYIHISHSSALTSLSFFKKLRIIKGEKLYINRYALFVLENQNLQDIWDFGTHPNLTIGKGLIFFHFNRKLCLNKIDQLISITGLKNETTDIEVSRQTNGDQVACNLTMIKLIVKKFPHFPPEVVFLSWPSFQTPDYRELLNWVVHYREAPKRNITMFDARDACGTDIWKTVDARPKPETDENIVIILHDLIPFTQYAVYVKTYTVSSATRGAISALEYFVTSPSVPTEARDIRVQKYRSRELHISWKPPLKPHGVVTHYVVHWTPMLLDPKKFELRNYCEDKLKNYNKSKSVDKEENTAEITKNITDANCCACPGQSVNDKKITEEDRISQIQFQNKLQNKIYKPKGGTSMGKYFRKKRDAASLKYEENSNNDEIVTRPPDMNNTMSNGTENDIDYEDGEAETAVEYYYAFVENKTETILPDLHHFQEYSIEIIACHDYDSTTKTKLCSNRAIFAARTLPDIKEDTINERNISIDYMYQTNGTFVKIKWLEPKDPNGLIVTYDIEIRGMGQANLKPTIYCITQKRYKEHGGFIITELGHGNFSFRIRCTSLAGYGPWTPERFFNIDEVAQSERIWGVLIASLILLVVIIVLVAIGIAFYYNKKRSKPSQSALYASINPDYWGTSDIYVPDEWEVERDKIEMIAELGQGSFGMVYEGIAKNLNGIPKQNVAIKTVSHGASIKDRIEFLNEASVMKAFNCTHVVKLLGVVSQGQPSLVIMELMSRGDLKSFLRLHRPDYEGKDGQSPPSLKEILQMAAEIADGMNYLSAKKFVHRDLAARNCMVSSSKVVKIGDFGMTRDVYETDYYRKGGKGLLPVRWMAPESLHDGLFSTQSDVWSYGIVLWEMATLAAQPYQGLANEQVLKFVVDGNVMEKPDNCNDRLYDMMLNCWCYNPRDRSSFNEIITDLLPDVHESFSEVSYYFSDANQEHLKTLELESESEEHLPTASLNGSPTNGLSDSYRQTNFSNYSDSNHSSLSLSSNQSAGSVNFEEEPLHLNNLNKKHNSPPPLPAKESNNIGNQTNLNMKDGGDTVLNHTNEKIPHYSPEKYGNNILHMLEDGTEKENKFKRL